MYCVIRHIEKSTVPPPKQFDDRLRVITYTVTCDSCRHRCTLTFRTRGVSLFAENEKAVGALSLLCRKLADEDSADLVGLMHRIFVVNDKNKVR